LFDLVPVLKSPRGYVPAMTGRIAIASPSAEGRGNVSKKSKVMPLAAAEFDSPVVK